MRLGLSALAKTILTLKRRMRMTTFQYVSLRLIWGVRTKVLEVL